MFDFLNMFRPDFATLVLPSGSDVLSTTVRPWTFLRRRLHVSSRVGTVVRVGHSVTASFRFFLLPRFDTEERTHDTLVSDDVVPNTHH